MRRSDSLPLAGIAAAISLVCAAGCAVALAPGFQIARETRSVHFVAGPTPQLGIRAEFTLVNSGTSELNFVDVRLPTETSSGRGGLRVQVDGQDAKVAPLATSEQDGEPEMVRITFAKPWMRKQKRELIFEYALSSPVDSQSYVTIGPEGFHLGVRGWAPQLQPPKYLLSTYPSRPVRISYSVRVPAEFAVLGGGARKGQKKVGNEIEYRFELGGATLGAFAVAGRYAKWPANEQRNSVTFWTSQPLVGNPAPAAQQIANVWKTLTSDFGEFDKNIREPQIAESAGVRYDIQGETGPAAVSFPGGALANPAAFALGIESDGFLRVVTEALARNWFDEAVLPSSDAVIGMGEGLPEYAEIVAEEARNGALARRQRIYEFLRRYDAAVKYVDETPIAATTMESPLPQRRIALAKAPLFYIELEDACGETPVRAGIAHLLDSMRGQEVDYNVLRSTLEQSTGRELGKMFREWLNQKGIPKNFRARYRYGEGAEETGN